MDLRLWTSDSTVVRARIVAVSMKVLKTGSSEKNL